MIVGLISHIKTSLYNDLLIVQVPVVPKLVSAMHRTNYYPENKLNGNQLHYNPERDLSSE